MLKPAYECDRWFQKKRLCEEWRNVGSTVTFVLATPPPEMVGKVKIEWFQMFYFVNGTSEKNITYNINPKDPPWNMVIGSGGRELRISPITESDILLNYFTAIAHFERGSPTRKLDFAIQAMPTDIGIVYPGDTVTLHMPSYVSLPAESMVYYWHMEGVTITLPSNMRPSRSGASVTISELRKEQEGTLTCSVFTNLGVFATQKRFEIKRVERGNSELLFIATRPPHQFIPLTQWNALLTSMLDTISKVYGKRDSRTVPNATDQLDTQLLQQLLSKMPKLKKYLIENYNLTIERKKRSLQPSGSPDYFFEPVDSQQADTNIKPYLYLPKEESDFPFVTRRLNKRQYDETPEAESYFDPPMMVEGKEYDLNEKYESETTNTPQLLQKFLSKMPKSKKYQTLNYNLINERKTRSLQPSESPDYFSQPVDSLQADTNIKQPSESPGYFFEPVDNRQADTKINQPSESLGYLFEPVDSRKADISIKPDFYLPSEESEFQFSSRGLNKREDDEIPEAEKVDFEAPVVVESQQYDWYEKDESGTTNTPKQGGYFGNFDPEEDIRFEEEVQNVETPPPETTTPLSFLERHRQAILSHLYTSKSRRKPMKISKKRLRTTTEISERLDEERVGTLPPLQERDIIAMLLSECLRDSQCALNAECIKREKGKPGFCRCRPKFEGNGIFCWENDNSVE